MTRFEHATSWTQTMRSTKLNYIPKVADYCELAICNGVSFDFSLTWGWDMAQWHNCAKLQNGLQQINFCTIRHIIDGVCCHDFRRRFYHVWDFSVMSSRPSSRMICCKKPIEGFEPTTCRLRCECTAVVLYRQKSPSLCYVWYVKGGTFYEVNIGWDIWPIISSSPIVGNRLSHNLLDCRW